MRLPLSVCILVVPRAIYARLTVDECTKNFACPFHCGAHAFRTNKELLSHCDKAHEEKLGNQSIAILSSIIYRVLFEGLSMLTFPSMREFVDWKEREEEATYSTYVKSQQTYRPSSSGN